MNQEKYIIKMAKTFKITDDTKPTNTPLPLGVKLGPPPKEEKQAASKLPYQELVGGLIYAIKTRFEIAYAVSDVARFMGEWGEEHFKAALHILRYLYSTKEQSLTIKPTPNAPLLVAYCDANWKDVRDTGPEYNDKYKSQTGYLIFFAGSLVQWRSRRQGEGLCPPWRQSTMLRLTVQRILFGFEN